MSRTYGYRTCSFCRPARPITSAGVAYFAHIKAHFTRTFGEERPVFHPYSPYSLTENMEQALRATTRTIR